MVEKVKAVLLVSFLLAAVSLAFWADWRIGLAFCCLGWADNLKNSLKLNRLHGKTP